MPKYTPRDASDIWDELKEKIPKLIRGVCVGQELIEFEATEDLTSTELGIIEKVTGKEWEKVGGSG